jgi:hypothetical protein
METPHNSAQTFLFFVQQRTPDDLEDIVKFTRKLDFFKNMAEASREELCRTMVFFFVVVLVVSVYIFIRVCIYIYSYV